MGCGGWRLSGSLRTAPPKHSITWLTPKCGSPTSYAHDLTAERATFTDADLVRVIAARQGAGTSVATIERVAARFVASDQVIAVHDHTDVPRWTSRELVDVETRFLHALTLHALTLPDSRPLITGPLQAVGEHAGLGADQAAVLQRIVTSTSAVSVLIGPAGTGKTYTLDAIRSVFETSGYRVIGAAPSARAALELTAGAHLPTSTLHALLHRWDTGLYAPDNHTVLVVDEAGLADIRTLETVVSRHTAVGGRVLLVGDHRQLAEVGAGGGFAYAADHAITVAELTVNRRQRDQWEQSALADLRDGSVARAVAAYLDHDRVIVADTPTGMVAAGVDAWLAARDQGLRPVLMSGTNDLVDTLNQAVIDRLIERGELDPTTPGGRFGDRCFRVGERVVVRRNSTREHTTTGAEIALANGQTGTITAVADGAVSVRLDGFTEDVTLTARYLQRGGHVEHSYAITTNRAQGGTWDLAIAVGADGLYREGAYVQLSRGIRENWIVLTDPEAAELHRQATVEIERHDTGLTPTDELSDDLEDDLITRMNVSRAKHLAHHDDPDLTIVDRLARDRTLPELDAHLTRARAAEHAATAIIGADRRQLAETFDRADHLARHLAVGQAVSPHDRHNIGTVAAIDDTTGDVEVQFTSRTGAEAAATFRWDQLRIVEPVHPEPHPLTDTAAVRLIELHDQLTDQIRRWDDILATHDVEPGDVPRYQRAISRQVDRTASRLHADHPDWLHQLIGQRPGDVAGAHTWDDTLRTIARWQLTHPRHDLADGLGPRPADHERGREWDDLHTRIGLTRTWLASSDRLEPVWPITPSYTELIARLDTLDMLLATMPGDAQATIDHLRTGQLSFDDTTAMLEAAIDLQDDRRAWIIENWPHVVEYQQINHTLTTGTWGPDPALLTDLLDTPITDTLAEAIETSEPWLRPALHAVADRNDLTLNPAAADWLEATAEYRATHAITTFESLGPSALMLDGHGAHQRSELSEWLSEIQIDRLDAAVGVEHQSEWTETGYEPPDI